MNKAVFLDRDGILNKELGDYVTTPEELEILPDVVSFLKELTDRGYLLIVITNQSGIIKGRYTHEDLHAIHNKMDGVFQQEGVKIKEFYYSPYHQDYCNSLNLKPGSLMIERAMAKYGIDPKRSFMIGDRPRDVEAGKGAGVRSFLRESNTSLLPLLEQMP